MTLKYCKRLSPIYLKFEGSEYPVFYSADQDTLNRFSYIYIEIHEGKWCPTTYSPKMEKIQALLDYLEYMGFKVLNDVEIMPEVHVFKLFNDRKKKVLRASS